MRPRCAGPSDGYAPGALPAHATVLRKTPGVPGRVPCLPTTVGRRSGTAACEHTHRAPSHLLFCTGGFTLHPNHTCQPVKRSSSCRAWCDAVSLQTPCLTHLTQDHPSFHCSSPEHLAPILHQTFLQVVSWESGLGGHPAIPSPPAPGSVPPVPTSPGQAPPRPRHSHPRESLAQSVVTKCRVHMISWEGGGGRLHHMQHSCTRTSSLPFVLPPPVLVCAGPAVERFLPRLHSAFILSGSSLLLRSSHSSLFSRPCFWGT